MPTRDQRARVAQETVAISYAGSYKSPGGQSISLLDGIRTAIESTELIAPAAVRSLHARADRAIGGRNFATRFEVANETTLSSARRLVDRVGPHCVQEPAQRARVVWAPPRQRWTIRGRRR